MLLLYVTYLLVALMAINHLVHGFGCWGLQPGGQYSAPIYTAQIIAAVVGLGWLGVAMVDKRVPVDAWRLAVIALFVIASVVMFALFGERAHTSAHRQGAENLLAYLMVAATTFLVGRYISRAREPAIMAGSDEKTAESNAPPRPRSDNPYEPPQDKL